MPAVSSTAAAPAVSTTTLFGGTEPSANDLIASLRSALAGFTAQTGFGQCLVTQLIGSSRAPRTGAAERLEQAVGPI